MRQPSEDEMYPTYTIGMLGLGTVGCGVVKYLREHYAPSKTGLNIEIGKILVRDISKPRKVEVDAPLLTTNPDDILENLNIDVVVEVMGGIEPAGPYILRALGNGKHVVTANKALLAHPSSKYHTGEVDRLISEGKWPNGFGGNIAFLAALTNQRNLGFEASVCGEIPVIDVISAVPSSNAVVALEGIINGTSNYILTKMSEGKSYQGALKEAQDRGFAEADPSFDVDGLDAAQKLALLSTLIFGKLVEVPEISRESISSVTAEDIRYAKDFGYIIKPIAVAEKHAEGLELRVCPALISEKNPLANVNNETNAVSIYFSGREEPMTLRGKGAGMIPTASSVVADIVRVIKDSHESRSSIYNLFTCSPENPMEAAEQFLSRFYLKFIVKDEPMVIAGLATSLGKMGISIESIEQQIRDKKDNLIPVVLLTHSASEYSVNEALAEIKKQPYLQGFLKLRVRD